MPSDMHHKYCDKLKKEVSIFMADKKNYYLIWPSEGRVILTQENEEGKI